MTCANHPNLRWHCKEIAVGGNKYNGSRKLFYSSIDKRECKCHTRDLITVRQYHKDLIDDISKRVLDLLGNIQSSTLTHTHTLLGDIQSSKNKER